MKVTVIIVTTISQNNVNCSKGISTLHIKYSVSEMVLYSEIVLFS